MSWRKGIIPLVIVLIASLLFTSYSNSKEVATPEEAARKKKSKAIQEVTSPPIPESLTFVGEKVPLENFDIKESLDRELMVNTYFHSQTLRFIKMAPRYFKIIEPILEHDSIPTDFKYLALAESGLNPKAVSPAGAVGLWQFLKGTAKENGLEVSGEVDERYHIEKATGAACKYLKESYKKYGNWTTVAASYNVGRRGVDKQIERQKEDHYYNLLFNEETSRYVFRILALKLILENPEEYGFFIKKRDIYPTIPIEIVEVNGKVESFADFAKEHNINYKLLKYFNPWLRETYLTNKLGKTYEIKIPKGKYRSY